MATTTTRRRTSRKRGCEMLPAADASQKSEWRHRFPRRAAAAAPGGRAAGALSCRETARSNDAMPQSHCDDWRIGEVRRPGTPRHRQRATWFPLAQLHRRRRRRRRCVSGRSNEYGTNHDTEDQNQDDDNDQGNTMRSRYIQVQWYI